MTVQIGVANNHINLSYQLIQEAWTESLYRLAY